MHVLYESKTYLAYHVVFMLIFAVGTVCILNLFFFAVIVDFEPLDLYMYSILSSTMRKTIYFTLIRIFIMRISKFLGLSE
mmetsp:Transcript_5874/g.6762  ORF Transcript_5874/g.6762 Transcript_5874/m.6762 type:complete len:80 (+) Transcript_5874:181-420(+)